MPPRRAATPATDAIPALQGVIKRLVKEKGFGFIRDTQGVDYFFHRSVVERAVDFDGLEEGTHVRFDPEDGGDKGPRATNVHILS